MFRFLSGRDGDASILNRIKIRFDKTQVTIAAMLNHGQDKLVVSAVNAENNYAKTYICFFFFLFAGKNWDCKLVINC
jgi:hypothetical protein